MNFHLSFSVITSSIFNIFSSKPVVFIPVEILKRDLYGRLALMRLIRSGLDVFCITGEKRLVDFLAKNLAKKGDIYIDKSCTLNENRISLYQRFYNVNCRIGVFDDEGVVMNDMESYLKPRLSEKLLKYVNYIFAWNQKHFNFLRQLDYINPENVYLTGHPRTIPLKIIKELKRHHTDNSSFKILYCSNGRARISNNAIEVSTKALSAGNYPDSFIERWFKAQASGCLDFIFHRKCLLLLADSGFNITVRPHPSESTHLWGRLLKHNNITVDSKSPLEYQFGSHNVLLHNGCTTALQAHLVNLHSIALDPEDRAPSSLANKYSKRITNTSELLVEINQLKSLNTNAKESLYRRSPYLDEPFTLFDERLFTNTINSFHVLNSPLNNQSSLNLKKFSFKLIIVKILASLFLSSQFLRRNLPLGKYNIHNISQKFVDIVSPNCHKLFYGRLFVE